MELFVCGNQYIIFSRESYIRNKRGFQFEFLLLLTRVKVVNGNTPPKIGKKALSPGVNIEKECSLEVEAVFGGRKSRFVIPADKLTSMNWHIEELGAKALIYPGYSCKDHARAAIQMLSEDVGRKVVYTHTGWCKASEHWVYLHSGGAIGSDGPEASIEVELPKGLAGYSLPDPPPDEQLQQLFAVELALLDVAPDHITVPLLAATFRSVLGGVDHSISLTGSTGAGKSELAALMQQHFGGKLDARHLPANWSSTANAIEGMAFACKDVLLVIDDFAPGGARSDVDKAHRDAARIFRSQGNRSSRQRMRADTTLRPPKPPRSLILSTGEDAPRGQSIRARMLVVEVGPNDVDWDKLTECQKHAAAGDYAALLSGFIRWLAPRYGSVREGLPEEIADLRQKATQSHQHKRTPEIIANLALGIRYFLRYVAEVGGTGKEAIAEVEQRCLERSGAGC